MHVAGTFPDNYVYGKCTYYIWEYGEIGKNNTYLCTDHLLQVYIPCRIPCSSLVQYSLNYSLITRYSTTLNFLNQLLAIKGTLASLHCCCPSFVATISRLRRVVMTRLSTVVIIRLRRVVMTRLSTVVLLLK